MVKSEIASSVIRFVAILPFSLHLWASGNFMKKVANENGYFLFNKNVFK